jgi:hypothetical protein
MLQASLYDALLARSGVGDATAEAARSRARPRDLNMMVEEIKRL